MPHYKFSEIAFNITEKRMPTTQDKDLYVGLEHLDSGSLAVTRWGSPVEIKGQKLVMSKGDLLFGRRNTYLKRAAIAPHDGLFSAHGMIFRPKTRVINSELFPFFISSAHFMEEAIRISVGSLSPTVNWGTLKDLEFDLPPIEKQSMLTEVLVAANETKEAYKNLLSITDELLKSQFIELFGDPATNMKRWPIVSLKDLFNVRSSKRVYQGEQTNQGVPFLRVADLVQKIGGSEASCDLYISDEQYNDFLQNGLVPNSQDILVTTRGTLGKCYIIQPNDRFYFQDGMISWLEKTDVEVESVYISYFFEMDSLKRQVAVVSKGATVDFLSLDKLGKLKIMYPDYRLQRQFAAFVQQVDKSKFELQQTLDKLNATMKMLMQ